MLTKEESMKKFTITLLALIIPFAMSGCNAEQTEIPYDHEYMATQSDTAMYSETTTDPELKTEPIPEPEPIQIRIQFAGDVLLHGGIGMGIGDNRFDYKPIMWAIRPYIDGDLALVNMETPVDVFGNNQNIATWPLFNVPFEILEALIYAGFNHLISANNHSFDKGFDGLVATLANFERAGISQTGMYTNEADFNTPTIINVQGIQVGIIAYTDTVNRHEHRVPDDVRPFAVRRFRSRVMDDVPYMAADIARIREAGADLVIISLHWGEEYVDAPTNMQRQIAHALVEAGADIIMGHHSHTPQPLEWYEREDGSRGLIMYSLGNFLSDQIRLGIPATQYGMLVTVYVTLCPHDGISMDNAIVLPTVFVRESARTLGSLYSILPIVNGEVPDTVASTYLRAWGRRAYAHTLRIVGAEFVYGSQ